MEIIDGYRENKFVIHYPVWAHMEIKQVIREQLFRNKCVTFGYNISKEFHEAKNDVPYLTEEELDIFSQVLSFFLDSFAKENAISVPIEPYELNIWMENTGCDIMDTIHYYQACKNNCKYFVTNDGELVKGTEKYNKKEGRCHTMKSTEFIEKMKTMHPL